MLPSLLRRRNPPFYPFPPPPRFSPPPRPFQTTLLAFPYLLSPSFYLHPYLSPLSYLSSLLILAPILSCSLLPPPILKPSTCNPMTFLASVSFFPYPFPFLYYLSSLPFFTLFFIPFRSSNLPLPCVSPFLSYSLSCSSFLHPRTALCFCAPSPVSQMPALHKKSRPGPIMSANECPGKYRRTHSLLVIYQSSQS
jgi:hypothetical protein